MAVTGYSQASRLGLIFICGILAALVACSDNPTAPKPPAQARDSVHWSGSSVIYDTSIVKKEYSALFFMASWCGWCNKLKKETLTDTAVVRILNESFNCVGIDPDADTLLQYKDSLVSAAYFTSDLYGVTGYPTIFLLDRTGVSLLRLSGYRPADTLARELEGFLTGH